MSIYKNIGGLLKLGRGSLFGYQPMIAREQIRSSAVNHVDTIIVAAF